MGEGWGEGERRRYTVIPAQAGTQGKAKHAA